MTSLRPAGRAGRSGSRKDLADDRLLPEFLPVIGPLDDVVVALALRCAARQVPADRGHSV